MKATFSFKGYCEKSRLSRRNIAAIEWEDSESRARIQVGKIPTFKDDIPVKVTIIVETR